MRTDETPEERRARIAAQLDEPFEDRARTAGRIIEMEERRTSMRRMLTQFAASLVVTIIGLVAVLTLVPPTAWPAPISALAVCVGALGFVLKRRAATKRRW